jgi:hypothetical protein
MTALEKDRNDYGSLYPGNAHEAGCLSQDRQAHGFLAGGDFVGKGFAADRSVTQEACLAAPAPISKL